MIKGGIYMIKNIINNKIYIGSTKNFRIRRHTHFRELKNNIHCNNYLQKAWNKYGSDNFEFNIIEEVINNNKLIEREQYYIDKLNPDYNILKIAGNTLGMKHSDETKDKISKALKNPSIQTRIKMSIIHKGKKLSDEHKLKISKSGKGRIVSDETRDKLSEINKGKIPSDKCLLNAALVNKGRKHSEEARLKISDANKGKPKSDETKNKMRLAALNRNAQRKGAKI